RGRDQPREPPPAVPGGGGRRAGAVVHRRPRDARRGRPPAAPAADGPVDGRRHRTGRADRRRVRRGHRRGAARPGGPRRPGPRPVGLDLTGPRENTMRCDLGGKVSLVTGAARGIGRAIADRLAANGSVVYYTDLVADEALAAAAASPNGRGLRLDVTDPEQI